MVVIGLARHHCQSSEPATPPRPAWTSAPCGEARPNTPGGSPRHSVQDRRSQTGGEKGDASPTPARPYSVGLDATRRSIHATHSSRVPTKDISPQPTSRSPSFQKLFDMADTRPRNV